MENTKQDNLQVGQFQKNLVETTVMELLFKNYGSTKEIYWILSKYCECKKLRLSILYY